MHVLPCLPGRGRSGLVEDRRAGLLPGHDPAMTERLRSRARTCRR